MAEINPLRGLYNDFVNIANDCVIKYSTKADEYETLDTQRSSELYVGAKLCTDNFFYYGHYEKELLNQIGITEPAILEQYLASINNIPTRYHDQLLALKRAKIISEYVEQNNYYRMLAGLPDIEDTDYVYVTDKTEYSIPPDVPVHLMEDAFINILDELGVIDELIAKYPKKKYLGFLGAKRIDITTSRTAKNMSLLRLPDESKVSDTMLSQFKLIYEQCREYFMSVIYVYEYTSIYDYYDNFIALSIMIMTIQQLVARVLKSTIDRNFFDEYCIDLLFKMYNIPDLPGLDLESKRAISQNLNMLIKHKSTDKVLYNIANILGFDNIGIYKYLLVKQRKYDENDLPIIATKTVTVDGEEETVPDYPAMYDVYFQKLEVKDKDIYTAVQDKVNTVSYDDVTMYDPMWQEDDSLLKSLYESEYNFTETKYLGLNISFKLSEVMFESIYFLGMCQDKKSEVSSLYITMPKILGDTQVNLFDAVIALCAMLSKKNSLTGEILNSASQILYVLGFNFDNDFAAIRQDIRDNKYLDNAMVDYLSVTNMHSTTAVNTLYQNMHKLRSFISDAMASTTDIHAYNAYEKLYKTLFIKAANNTMFNIGTEESPVYASTYMEYLQHNNYDLYVFINETPADALSTYIAHVLSKLSTIVDQLKYLYYINDSNGGAIKSLVTLIRFFKSYTTDLIGLNIVYLFDTKALNMIHLIDELHAMTKTNQYIDKMLLGYADHIKHLSSIYRLKDNTQLNDMLNFIALFMVGDELSNKISISDGLHSLHTCHLGTDEILMRYTDRIKHIIGTYRLGDNTFLSDSNIISILLDFKLRELNLIPISDGIHLISKDTTYQDIFTLEYADSIKKLISTYRNSDNAILTDAMSYEFI